MAGKGSVWKAVFLVPALGPGRAPADGPQGIVKIDHDDVACRLGWAELFEGVVISEEPQASVLIGNALESDREQNPVGLLQADAQRRATTTHGPHPCAACRARLAGRQQQLHALAAETQQRHEAVRARILLAEACRIHIVPR